MTTTESIASNMSAPWFPEPILASDTRQASPVASDSRTTTVLQYIAAARAGDEGAFQRLVEAHWSLAVRMARHIMKTEEAAADAVQDALIKIHQAMPRFQDGNFRSWLLRIVTNTCYDHLRRQKRRPATSLEQLMDESQLEVPEWRTDQDPERFVLRQEQCEILSRAVDGLPSWHRDVIVLIDMQGYDYSEAAELLGLPLGTVKSRLSRARASLRDQLVASQLLAERPIS